MQPTCATPPQRGTAGALLDRLLLDDQRIEAMARGLEDIERLADPIGRRLTHWSRPNGLRSSECACLSG